MRHTIRKLNLKGLGIFMIGVGISGFFLSLFINAQFSGQGAGSWDVVKAALQIESHLSGNDMDVYSFNDPGIQPALAYWHQVCGWQPGHLCLNTLPVGWLRLDTASNQYVQCGGPGNGCAYYDRFHALQCVMFVDAAYAVAGHPLPDINENGGNFFGAYAHIAGWQEVRAGTGLPLPGDLLGMSGGPFGHIAVVVSVAPPQGNTPGSIVIAHANAPANIITPSPYAPGINTPGIHLFQIPLMPDLTVPPVWGDYQVQGYIRNPSLVRYSWSGGERFAAAGAYLPGRPRAVRKCQRVQYLVALRMLCGLDDRGAQCLWRPLSYQRRAGRRVRRSQSRDHAVGGPHV
jgi:hypothetical protein